MSSGSERRAALAGAALIAALAVVVACRQQSTEPAFIEAPSIGNVAVGPLPGLAEAPPEPANPFTDDADALLEGRRFFTQYNCGGCHGDHGGGGMGPSLRDASWIYGGTDAKIASSIAEGRAYGMPAWGAMLTPAQTWQITAYIKSMRTEREPDAPAGR